MTYTRILRPLFDSLRLGAAPASDALVGQEIKTRRPDVGAFLSLDNKGTVHFLISPAPVSDSKFARFRLKTFSIDLRRWIVARSPARVYLDVSCRTGEAAELARPFLAFCEDLLLDLDHSSVAVEDAVFRAAQRWYRFWNRESTHALSEQAVRGLLGELSFLAHLIAVNGTGAINVWTGPERRDHDFQKGRDLAVEVKTSAVIPYRIECNLNQLDRGLFGALYLVCFAVQKSSSGVTLPALVARIKATIAMDEDASEAFERKLILVGYETAHEAEYSQQQYSIAAAEAFVIDDEFPAITLSSFTRPPDMRVVDVRYVLEMVALQGSSLASEPIAASLARLR